MTARLTIAQQRARVAWFYLAPLLIALLLVAAWPLLRTILFSLTDANLSDLTVWKFVGLANYLYLFQDPLWWRAVGNTLIFTFLSVGLETILGLIIALTLDAHLPAAASSGRLFSFPGPSRPSSRPRCGPGCCMISMAS